MTLVTKIKKSFICVLVACLPVFASTTTLSSSENEELNKLKSNYVTEEETNYNGIATGVIVTNSLLEEDELPVDQASFFNNEVREAIKPSIVHARGIELDELDKSLQAHNLNTEIFYATTFTPASLSEIIENVTSSPLHLMIVQYDQSLTSLNKGVVYGIVANYSAKEKRVLIMHTNPNGKKFKWVKIDDLLKGMQALNEDCCPRGFIIVSKPTLDDHN